MLPHMSKATCARARWLAVLLAVSTTAVAACSSSGTSASSPTTTAGTATTTTLAAGAPTPTSGTFGVGRRDVTFVDRSRPTDGNAKQKVAPKDDRELPTVILYPTKTASDNATNDVHAVAPGRFPLLIFSHGVTASGPAYVRVLEKIAAAGYVVALPTYPLTSGKGGWANVSQVTNQPADVSFLITQMLKLGSAPAGKFSGHLASDEVGVSGHSLGAITSLLFYNSCCFDKRVKAVVAISGILFPSKAGNYDNPPTNLPLLLLHGEKDKTLSYAAGSRHIFDTFTDVPRALVSFPDAGHIDVLGKKGFTDSFVAFLDLELRHDDSDWRKLSGQLDTFGTATIEVGGGLESPS